MGCEKALPHRAGARKWKRHTHGGISLPQRPADGAAWDRMATRAVEPREAAGGGVERHQAGEESGGIGILATVQAREPGLACLLLDAPK